MFSHTYITFFQLPFFQLHSFIAFFHCILSLHSFKTWNNYGKYCSDMVSYLATAQTRRIADRASAPDDARIKFYVTRPPQFVIPRRDAK